MEPSSPRSPSSRPSPSSPRARRRPEPVDRAGRRRGARHRASPRAGRGRGGARLRPGARGRPSRRRGACAVARSRSPSRSPSPPSRHRARRRGARRRAPRARRRAVCRRGARRRARARHRSPYAAEEPVVEPRRRGARRGRGAVVEEPEPVLFVEPAVRPSSSPSRSCDEEPVAAPEPRSCSRPSRSREPVATERSVSELRWPPRSPGGLVRRRRARPGPARGPVEEAAMESFVADARRRGAGAGPPRSPSRGSWPTCRSRAAEGGARPVETDTWSGRAIGS